MLRDEVQGARGPGRYCVVFAQALPEYVPNNQRRKSTGEGGGGGSGLKQRPSCTACAWSARSSAALGDRKIRISSLRLGARD